MSIFQTYNMKLTKIKMRSICLLIAVSALNFSGYVFAFKAKEPSPQEAAHLIALAKNRKTSDGATVMEVLRYAEKLRKGKFKLAGDFELNYDNNGNLSGINICYWIGAKRLSGDEFCDIAYDISDDKKFITPSVGSLPQEQQENLTVIRVEHGRDAFLEEIDKRYIGECIDQDTKKKFC